MIIAWLVATIFLMQISKVTLALAAMKIMFVVSFGGGGIYLLFRY